MESAITTPPPAVVTKSQFAALTRVSQSRVSQWISERKISGNALVGEGRDQKIVVEAACQQLNRTLDIGQRLGNGLDTRLDHKAAALPLAPPAVPQPDPVDTVEEQIKRARLAQIEFQNRKAAEEEAARAGALTDRETAQMEMGKIAAQMVMVFEGALAEFATAIAAKFQVTQRDVLHLLRTEFRKVRVTAAVGMKDQSAGLPATVAHEIETEQDDST